MPFGFLKKKDGSSSPSSRNELNIPPPPPPPDSISPEQFPDFMGPRSTAPPVIKPAPIMPDFTEFKAFDEPPAPRPQPKMPAPELMRPAPKPVAPSPAPKPAEQPPRPAPPRPQPKPLPPKKTERPKEVDMVEIPLPDVSRPLYVKIGHYKKILDNLDAVYDSLRSLQNTATHIEMLTDKEESRFKEWFSNLEFMRKKMIFVDKTLFEG